MDVLTKADVAAVLPSIDLMAEIEAGFVAYSRGESVVPPVGELLFEDPPGEVHIKYGYITGDNYYVIKVASGFAANRDLGIPTSNGLMLLFSQQTGELVAVLHDEGILTDIRTAVAGAIAAKHLDAEVAGVSLVTNLAAGLGGELSHAEVLEVAEVSTDRMVDVIAALIRSS